MKKLLAGTTIALLFGGAALAQDDMVTISVDGEQVEVDMATAMEACGPEVDVATMAGTDEVACEIDQATADMHGINGDDADDWDAEDDADDDLGLDDDEDENDG
jgi:hypothetical protein